MNELYRQRVFRVQKTVDTMSGWRGTPVLCTSLPYKANELWTGSLTDAKGLLSVESPHCTDHFQRCSVETDSGHNQCHSQWLDSKHNNVAKNTWGPRLAANYEGGHPQTFITSYYVAYFLGKIGILTQTVIWLYREDEFKQEWQLHPIKQALS